MTATDAAGGWSLTAELSGAEGRWYRGSGPPARAGTLRGHDAEEDPDRAVVEHFDDRGVIDRRARIGYYSMLACVMNGVRVSSEEPPDRFLRTGQSTSPARTLATGASGALGAGG